MKNTHCYTCRVASSYVLLCYSNVAAEIHAMPHKFRARKLAKVTLIVRGCGESRHNEVVGDPGCCRLPEGSERTPPTIFSRDPLAVVIVVPGPAEGASLMPRSGAETTKIAVQKARKEAANQGAAGR